MRLSPQFGEPNPDMKEVDQVRYFSLSEIQALEQISPVNIEVAQRALSQDYHLLFAQTVDQPNRGPYTLFLG